MNDICMTVSLTHFPLSCQVWKHDNLRFELIAETEGLSKCILSVEVERIVVDGRERILAVSGQSDGLYVLLPSSTLMQLTGLTCKVIQVEHPGSHFVRNFLLLRTLSKSDLTFLRCLNRLLKPSTTPCRIGDADLALSPHQSGINGLSVSRRGQSLPSASIDRRGDTDGW